jgi:peptidoglycan hydrolase-like protein with peptidoglycan-binding domain
MTNPVSTLGIVEVLRRGMEGPAVETLQDRLIEFGYMTLEQKNTRPGRFGPLTETAVKTFQGDNLIDNNGTFDLQTQALTQQLTNGVRRDSQGGVVLPVQQRLVRTGDLKPEELTTESARLGPLTEEALRDFQSDHNLEPTGILTAATYRALYKTKLTSVPTTSSAGIDVNLPESGEGFRTFLREGGATQFGTQKAITALLDLARAWFQKHPECPIQFGHVSRKGGGPFFSTVNRAKLAHQTHKDGRTVDIRPIRKDNKTLPTETSATQYDPVRTKELVVMIRERHAGVDIIFNDRALNRVGLTRNFTGHHDHLHVRLPK